MPETSMTFYFHTRIAASLAAASLLIAAAGCRNNPAGNGQVSITPGQINGIPCSQMDDDALDREARRLAAREGQLKEVRDLRRQNDSGISPYLMPDSFESSELEKIRKALQSIEREKKKRRAAAATASAATSAATTTE